MNEQLLGQAFFGVCSLVTLVGALSTILAKNPIRSAMGLLLAISGIAGLYLALHAQLLAALQLIVYAGAVVILFVFVIMLLGPDATGAEDDKAAFWRYGGASLLVVSAIVARSLVAGAAATPMRMPAPADNFGSIEAIGRHIYTTALVPFEMVSLLFVVAVVGAVAVARGKHEPTAKPRKEGSA
jgi:NADH-quinone oxidoreductase subunit J